MAFVTDSNRPQPLRQPPPTACLTASQAASEVPSILMHPWRGFKGCQRTCKPPTEGCYVPPSGGFDPPSGHPGVQKAVVGEGSPTAGVGCPRGRPWPRARAVAPLRVDPTRGSETGTVRGVAAGTTSRGKGGRCREVRIGQGGRGRARGGERPMGTTACGGKGPNGSGSRSANQHRQPGPPGRPAYAQPLSP